MKENIQFYRQKFGVGLLTSILLQNTITDLHAILIYIIIYDDPMLFVCWATVRDPGQHELSHHSGLSDFQETLEHICIPAEQVHGRFIIVSVDVLYSSKRDFP